MPTTTLRKRLQEASPEQEYTPSGDDSWTDNESPRRKPQTPSPSKRTKTTQKKSEALQKKEWKNEWTQWVTDSKWEKDPAYRQKVKNRRLNREEMDALPYWEFENEYSPSCPGRRYAHGGVKMLAYRKLAMLSGLHKQGLSEAELLRRGAKLFQECQSKRHQKNPNMPMTPKTFRIFQKTSYSYSQGRSFEEPIGSWETPVWENGKKIGYWLMYQFDPDARDYEDDLPKERVRPVTPVDPDT
ncbi:hypothetical protein LAWI1_G005739 [Lachnellula willkommii]|uniref:Uncharacterized protein n=1 Tax=Lachnellula willkommii TaxID=215461 RepID=A0A559MHT5_9HELO|nr:hypothetical protein LAWI1_G005739 [Lachnellula willkommii]